MDREQSRQPLDDEELDQAVGGMGGGIQYETRILDPKADGDKVKALQFGICPFARKPGVVEHGAVNGISETQYDCPYCGIRWIIGG